MKIIRTSAVLLLALSFFLGTGCASNPSAATWQLPKKSDAQYGMIIGRISEPAATPESEQDAVREVFFFN